MVVEIFSNKIPISTLWLLYKLNFVQLLFAQSKIFALFLYRMVKRNSFFTFFKSHFWERGKYYLYVLSTLSLHLRLRWKWHQNKPNYINKEIASLSFFLIATINLHTQKQCNTCMAIFCCLCVCTTLFISSCCFVSLHGFHFVISHFVFNVVSTYGINNFCMS